MELRVLKYFIEIAREENMSRAAVNLHISQPSLSKEMKKLEEELGKKLFRRGSASMKLTDEGMLLRKRAEDIVNMTEKTIAEFHSLDELNGGDIYIGCAESHLMKYIAWVIKKFRKKYPLFRYHIISGNTEQVTEKLDKGLLDFAVIVEPPDLLKYNYIELPETDKWGLLMRKDNPLAEKKYITFADLQGIPLICSEQSVKEDLPRWCGEKTDNLMLSGSVNLFYNGSVFVHEGLGCMLTFDKLAYTGEDSELCFRPLSPPLENKMYIILKKYQVFTPIAEKFIQELNKF